MTNWQHLKRSDECQTLSCTHLSLYTNTRFMIENPQLRKILKWTGLTVLTVLVLLTGVSVYFSKNWKPELEKKITEAVNKGSQGLYQVSVKDLHLNILTGSISADSIWLRPDTVMLNALLDKKVAPTHLFEIRLAKLQLRRLSLLRIWRKKEIDLNDIILNKPSINMTYYAGQHRPQTETKPKSLHELLSGTLHAVRIKAMRIADADFDYISGATGKKLNSVHKLNLTVRDFLLDEHSDDDTTRFYYTKDVRFEIAGYQSPSKDGMYTTKVDSITGSLRKKELEVKNFRMIPKYPELEFSRKLGTQKDRYDLHFKHILFSGIDYLRLNSEGVLHAQSLLLNSGIAKIFMNRELPGDATQDKTKNFPHMALQRLPVATTIDTLKLRQLNVAYTEYNPMAEQKGTIHIDHLKGNVLNVTNDSVSLDKSAVAVALLEADLVKAAHLNIRIDFKLRSPVAGFHYKGHIGPMDMVKLNPLSRALGLVEMESGKISKINFEAEGNRYGAKGKMQMRYTDLKIRLLKVDEDGGAPKKKGFLSFLANNILIKDSNPLPGKELREVKIDFERTPSASFFNLLWKSVFVGLRETVGLGIVPMKSPEQGNKDMQKKLKDRKEKRAEKQEEKKEEKKKKEQERQQNKN